MADSHVLIAATLIAACVVSMLWLFSLANTSACRDTLEDWLKYRKYTLVECHRRRLFRGPFIFRLDLPPGRGEPAVAVFRFVATDPDGNRHWGYARCLAATSPDDHNASCAEVEWD